MTAKLELREYPSWPPCYVLHKYYGAIVVARSLKIHQARQGVKMETFRRIASSHCCYTMRELNQNTAKVLREINESGEPALVTRQGRPIALITPLADEHVEATMLGAFLESIPQLTGEEPLSEVREPEEVAKDAGITYQGGYE